MEGDIEKLKAAETNSFSHLRGQMPIAVVKKKEVATDDKDITLNTVEQGGAVFTKGGDLPVTDITTLSQDTGTFPITETAVTPTNTTAATDDKYPYTEAELYPISDTAIYPSAEAIYAQRAEINPTAEYIQNPEISQAQQTPDPNTADPNAYPQTTDPNGYAQNPDPNAAYPQNPDPNVAYPQGTDPNAYPPTPPTTPVGN
jgi:hypothetical protein